MKNLFAIAAAALLTSACASIIKGGGPQSVTITSSPVEASVLISNKAGMQIANGTTPYTVALKASRGYFQGEDYVVTIRKTGFQDQTLTVSSSVNGWYVAGNIVFGGLIGWLIVDPLTGAMWTLGPEIVNGQLAADATAATDGGMALKVVLLENTPSALLALATPVSK